MLIIALSYAAGWFGFLITFLPFSPMTIDVVNLRRETQLAIYAHRHLWWALGAMAWVLAMMLGLIGVGTPAFEPGSVVLVIGISAAAVALMYWTGYVPIIMTPPGRTQRLSGEAAALRASPDDTVLGLVIGGEACAYLRDQIARPHYLIDRLGGREVVVSYCILCNSATAFEASLAGRPLDLRCVTAYNNNIIYRDRNSGNVIQQLDARVIAGPDTGATLNTVPVTVTRWADWLALHPHSALLDAPPQTVRDRMIAAMLGFLIPISKLARRERPWHRVRGALDARLGAMDFVIGVECQGEAAAYAINTVHEQRVVEDAVGGTPIVLFGSGKPELVQVFDRRTGERELAFEPYAANETSNGVAVIARDRHTGSLWDLGGRAVQGPMTGTQLQPVAHFNRLFWFSWSLFKPRVRLYSAPSNTLAPHAIREGETP